MALIGGFLVFIASILAYNSYNHFYEFMLIGLFLILLPFTIKEISVKTFNLLYIMLFAAQNSGINEKSPINGFRNVAARQWIYTGWPLQESMILGIPVTVFFIGWLALALLPVSLYYAVK